MRRALLEFELPDELVATHPPAERDGGRLLVVRPGESAHRRITDLVDLVPLGARIVVNDTRVISARLLGEKVATGGRVEILLVRPVESAGASALWEGLGRASKPLRPGAEIAFGGGLRGRIEGDPRGRPDGRLLQVRLTTEDGRPVDEAIEAVGQVPLPPYLGRTAEPADRERYQTVFAARRGAVAAPTAGLHLSEVMLEKLHKRGVEVLTLTLHVGLGTFEPVRVDDFDDHPMHAEWFEIPSSTAAAIARARAEGAPVLAVGTTVVRALESAAIPHEPGLVRAMTGETRLLIQPGYRFRVVDRLLTNFHLPGSTLLALVAAFAGTERVLAAYREAIAQRYRFYSYGDAMLLELKERS